MKFLRRGLLAPASLSVLVFAVACGGTNTDDTGAAVGGGGSGGSDSGGAGGTGTGASAPNSGGSSIGVGGATISQGATGGVSAGGTGADAGGNVGSSTGGNSALGALAVSGLSIEANPNMTISCYVKWTTDKAANSEVQFGVDGYQFHIVDDAEVTEHEILVIGMHADTNYDIRAVSTNASATGSDTGSFTTGALPSAVPTGTILTNKPDKTHSGWTLTNVEVQPGSNGSTSRSPAVIVMVDQVGVPVWYYINGTTADTRGDVATEALPNGNVLVGAAPGESPKEIDLAGNVVWTGPAQPTGFGAGEAITHHASKLKNGNYIVTKELGNGNGRVEELSPSNQVVWSWELFDHITEPVGTDGDWCHVNSATIDEATDTLYFNCRWQGLLKASRTGNMDVLWWMGAGQDGTNPGDVTFSPATSRFNDAHDPEIHADGTIMFYDNEGYDGRMTGAGNGSKHSRVLEYQVDDDKKEATLVWEFPGTFNVDPWFKDSWYTPFWGDADRLGNGNVLVTAGVRGTSATTHIFEVTNEGEVVWDMTWPTDHGSFRADRISPPPLVSPMP